MGSSKVQTHFITMKAEIGRGEKEDRGVEREDGEASNGIILGSPSPFPSNADKEVSRQLSRVQGQGSNLVPYAHLSFNWGERREKKAHTHTNQAGSARQDLWKSRQKSSTEVFDRSILTEVFDGSL